MPNLVSKEAFPLAVVKYWLVAPSAISSDVLAPNLASKATFDLAVVKNKLVVPSVTSSLLIVPLTSFEVALFHFKISLFCIPVKSTSLNVPMLELLRSKVPPSVPLAVISPETVNAPVIVPPVAPFNVSTVVACAYTFLA